MLKIPYGISDFRKIREDNYYYVDKTMYLSKLETEGDVLACFRPNRFGKSLFISMMYYYYDVNSKKLFKDLFKGTYVSDEVTVKKNSYYVLRFDFSNINVTGISVLDIEREFLVKVIDGISKFNADYGVEAKTDYSNVTPSGVLLEFLAYFRSLNLEHKLYIMIDEYDNFANVLLVNDRLKFRDMVGSEGFVSNFYGVIKEYYGLGVVDKVFITGECPVMLEAMTVDFNTYIDISRDSRFSAMMGLENEEVLKMLEEVSIDNRDKLFKVMLDNYAGYRFDDYGEIKVFNPMMVMYFMREYNKNLRRTNSILDINSAVGYGKIDALLKLSNNKYYQEVIDSLLKRGKITGQLPIMGNVNEDFGKNDIIGLLYYSGYLTISELGFGKNIFFGVPNYAMGELYGSYFNKMLRDIGAVLDNDAINGILKEILLEGKIEKLSRYVETILKYVDNKLFMKVDEQFIKLIYYVLLSGSHELYVYNDYKCGSGEVDLMLFKNIEMCKNDIMIEVRHLNSKDRINKKLIDKIRKGAEDELIVCQEDEMIDKKSLRKFVVIFSGSSLMGIEELI